MNLTKILATDVGLPVASAIADIATSRGNVVIAAPPGSGKTTLVPVVLAHQLEKTGHPKVLVVQPRRVAARAAARRIASLLGEPVGKQIGYRVRGETQPGRAIEMITPGVLLRMLHSDPELPGVGCVIIDEIHERDLDTDIACAFVLDVQSALRPDIRIIAMSATIALEQTAHLLNAEIISVPGDIHPVEIRDVPGPQALTSTAAGAIVVANEFVQHIARVVFQARSECDGSILVFVPGVRDIDAVMGRLNGIDLPVMALHGQLSSVEQDRVLDASHDRIIVATALAESSLTVPGVRVVVDSGLARQARVDGGIGGLVSVYASQASMIQRSGRAGREGPGVGYRCIAMARAPQYSPPEIRTADLTDALLQCAAWGAPNMAGLQLLDEPNPDNLAYAQRQLHGLGLIDDDGVITTRGRLVSQLPLGAHLARALIDASALVGSNKATDIVAFLSINMRMSHADIATGIRSKRTTNELTREIRRLRSMLTQLIPDAPEQTGDWTWDDAVGVVVGLAHPYWVARARGQGYVLANGRGAQLPLGSSLAGEEWLAIADTGQAQGRADAMIYAAAPIDADIVQDVARHLVTTETEIDAEKMRGYRVTRLGAIEIARHPVTLTDADKVHVYAQRIQATGVAGLTWTPALRETRDRLAFLHQALGEPWPDVSDTELNRTIGTWLIPFVTAREIDLAGALAALIPWEYAHQFDDLAPERIDTPLGSARVDYAGERPRVRMRIQEAFGWQATPEICGVPVTLELLSPAQRPLAITDDLASFWAGPYAGVRADMRGRYPRHPWPEDPAHAEPTRRAKKRK
ncbi:ATP-dependent helicase HrpB [Arcanobacterium buesumense]|uniref:ATP-dependent helicase HrpB n=1 Tax=Arcanobacterium buesumense TaxID=2722751 RepID=A0A6H2ENF5_9ACTO|nr:ATP-dependent helicase HrpB [Arcanobacterium buesumense]QJC22582.1 ATP-dependent helicase HrpB [Arcanobacterium buesumense]